jgi:hypothetical protein
MIVKYKQSKGDGAAKEFNVSIPVREILLFILFLINH